MLAGIATANAQVSSLIEGFESVTQNSPTPVAGWSAQNLSSPVGSTGWLSGPGTSTSLPAPHGGAAYIAANYNNTAGAGTISNWLFTPILNLQNGGVVKFWSRIPTGGGQYPDRLEVRLNTTNTGTNVGASATSVGDFTTVLVEINPTLSNTGYPETWTEYTVTLSGITTPTQGRVAFRYFVTDGGPSGNNSNYIAIDDFSYEAVPTPPPPCAQIVAPANGATGIDPYPTIKLDWTAVAGATSYDVKFGNTNPPTTISGNVPNDSAFISNQAYGTTYYWTVAPRNAGGAATGCPVWSFTTMAAPAPPANDSCGTPLPLMDVPQTGNTVGATQSMYATTCVQAGDAGTSDDDVWYSFTAINNGNVVVTVEGTYGLFDAVVEAYTGNNCSNLTRIGCIDTSLDGGREQLTIAATTGVTYRIRVFSWYSQLNRRGTFTIVGSGSALPVALSSFTGEAKAGKNFLLWTTASETNNAGFEVQRSVDGTDFSTIGKVNSKAEGGNSSNPINYSFTDGTPFAGMNYYRLVQTDKDGKTNYSSVISLKGAKTERLQIVSVYPNPAVNDVRVVMNAPEAGKVTLAVTDLSGRIVTQLNRQVATGDNSIDVNVASLAAGTYFIKVICDNGCETLVKKFVKN